MGWGGMRGLFGGGRVGWSRMGYISVKREKGRGRGKGTSETGVRRQTKGKERKGKAQGQKHIYLLPFS